MMVILVTAKNYVLIFVGLQGVGICAYLLVNFLFTGRVAVSNQSALLPLSHNNVLHSSIGGNAGVVTFPIFFLLLQ